MSTEEFDFFEAHVVPFATGYPHLANAIKNWPPSPADAEKLIEYSKIRPENNVVFSMYVAKYVGTGEGALKAQSTARDHIALVSHSLYMSGMGNYQPFRDAVLEFMADSPNNLAHFKALFAKIENVKVTRNLDEDDRSQPPEPA